MATRSIEETLEDLRESLDRLQADLRKQAQAAGKSIATEGPQLSKHARSLGESLYKDGQEQARSLLSAGQKLWDSATAGAGGAGENVRSVAESARGVLQDAASYADEHTRQTASELRDFVRERPLASVFLAVAAGLAISKLLDYE